MIPARSSRSLTRRIPCALFALSVDSWVVGILGRCRDDPTQIPAFFRSATMATGKSIREYQSVVTVADVSAARASALGRDAIAIVERGVPRWAVFRCPCGCDELLTVNLDPRTGPHWRLRRTKSRVSLSPSVWRMSGCHSHFILWKNRVWMFRLWGMREGEEGLPRDIDRELLREWRDRRPSNRQ